VRGGVGKLIRADMIETAPANRAQDKAWDETSHPKTDTRKDPLQLMNNLSCLSQGPFYLLCEIQ